MLHLNSRQKSTCKPGDLDFVDKMVAVGAIFAFQLVAFPVQSIWSKDGFFLL